MKPEERINACVAEIKAILKKYNCSVDVQQSPVVVALEAPATPETTPEKPTEQPLQPQPKE